MTRSWSGAAQSGSRDYCQADVNNVLLHLPKGRERAITLRTFTEMLGMEGRQVRAILSDHDGVDFLLAYDGDLFWDAECYEESHGHTEMLRARARTEMERVARRERYARTNLERLQGALAL